MTLLDSEHTTNVRAIIETKDISRYGFTLILTKHADSKQWGIAASWMACPARD
ncbi:hypothetical protein FSP39_006669 [Pinctada imbricata]|uniref:H-type lectin domain-containing protein n=1 Tax=Pinctada imbricata TaxID=66713 RepID=A0AA89C4Z4_PINIB|nr:hypothetical protein FSP39_006669 [Pinctada imbricata]